ncbi:U5 small nuclear ribonucleoprotein TSSC4 [Cylas formicarius]|uniref:U5 small nuclear ribonucleoprotein TSSC4 n=1 Tax=Cylas formicarius TaxID=197179 RepID=UPI00295879A4|nr:U5 small nuclear ribonucleoprotein TSSC4 [Cylas formicarius]
MSSFRLNSGDSDFRNRQKKIFDQLFVLESNQKASNNDTGTLIQDDIMSEDLEPQKSYIREKSKVTRAETKHFKGRESIFKKPQNPAPRNYVNRMPDFKKNPHKWTRYSLEGVDDITEESNTKSAMSFLKELAERKKIESGMEEESEELEELPSKIIFKRRFLKREHTTHQTAENKSSFENSRLVMAEYVVGQEVKAKRSKLNKPKKGVELKLDHLTAYEDE